MAERLIVDKDYQEIMRAAGARCYGDVLSLTDGCEPIASSRSGRTFRVQIGEDDAAIEGYLKIHDYSYWRRSRLRQDKGALEAANYLLLRDHCGIDVPDVIARGWRVRGLRYADGFILTRSVDGSRSLESVAAASDGAIDESLLRELAVVVRRMHAASYFHIDLQWRNILVVRQDRSSQDTGMAGSARIFLLDSPRGGLQSSAVGRAHGRIRDLSSLHKEARRWLGARVQLRWLKWYLDCERLSPIDRAMVRTILRDRSSKDRVQPA